MSKCRRIYNNVTYEIVGELLLYYWFKWNMFLYISVVKRFQKFNIRKKKLKLGEQFITVSSIYTLPMLVLNLIGYFHCFKNIVNLDLMRFHSFRIFLIFSEANFNNYFSFSIMQTITAFRKNWFHDSTSSRIDKFSWFSGWFSLSSLSLNSVHSAFFSSTIYAWTVIFLSWLIMLLKIN